MGVGTEKYDSKKRLYLRVTHATMSSAVHPHTSECTDRYYAILVHRGGSFKEIELSRLS